MNTLEDAYVNIGHEEGRIEIWSINNSIRKIPDRKGGKNFIEISDWGE